MSLAMTAILYPVAANAEEALSRPLGRAAREREARGVAGDAVAFVTEAVGPTFASREAALAAWRDRIEAAEADDRYCRLIERLPDEPGRKPLPGPVTPAFQDGRRWPAPPKTSPKTVWRLTVSYWRPLRSAEDIPAASEEALPDVRQARVARRGAGEVDAAALRAMARAPLRPVKPQQPLDIGLFETRLPEAPHIVVPDE
jgi:hypothetical protein